jgi:hypothetical protein
MLTKNTATVAARLTRLAPANTRLPLYARASGSSTWIVLGTVSATAELCIAAINPRRGELRLAWEAALRGTSDDSHVVGRVVFGALVPGGWVHEITTAEITRALAIKMETVVIARDGRPARPSTKGLVVSPRRLRTSYPVWMISNKEEPKRGTAG